MPLGLPRTDNKSSFSELSVFIKGQMAIVDTGGETILVVVGVVEEGAQVARPVLASTGAIPVDCVGSTTS